MLIKVVMETIMTSIMMIRPNVRALKIEDDDDEAVNLTDVSRAKDEKTEDMTVSKAEAEQDDDEEEEEEKLPQQRRRRGRRGRPYEGGS